MKSLALAGVLLLGADIPAKAQEAKPLVSPMFSDNMVLQREKPVPVWGWAPPGAKVNVTFKERGYVVEAGPDGKWTCNLPASSAGGPYWMSVSTASAPREVMFRNVMVGDVWLCSGQSNMEMGIEGVRDAQQEIANAKFDQIRLYTVPHRTAYEPEWDPRGQWLVCTPENIRKGTWGGFSAVAYFFGRDLYQRYNVPIGLIHSSWGGTPAEAWTSAETLGAKLPEFAPVIAQAADIRRQLATGNFNYERAVAEWVAKNDPGSNASPGWETPALDDSAWQTMALPQNWDKVGLENFDGVVWYRKAFDLPESAAGKDAVLHLGPIDDGDTTWVNGVMVGTTNDHQAPRNYPVPASALKAGRNVIAVRVYDIISNGGFWGNPSEMRLEIPGATTLSLAGNWQYTPSVEIAKMGPRPQDPNASMPGTPAVLYNGMIAPVVPYAIKGAIWYQGEANAPRAAQYRTLLPTMIADWRSKFGVGDFPFFLVQLANFMDRQPQPSESQWAELREAQTWTVQTVPNTGLAVAIDIGEGADIHPKNKQDVGHRLALAARKIAYGEKDLVASGPVYKRHSLEGNTLRISFSNAEGGLVAAGGKLAGFSVAGSDGKYIWADATVDGETVLVSSKDVPEPVYVRYAWADNPEATLYNAAGLPAVPFRTDGGNGKLVQPARIVKAPQAGIPPVDGFKEATATVAFKVRADGGIVDVKVLKSSDFRFNPVAADAARHIVATPATVNGRPADTDIVYIHTYHWTSR